MNFLQIKPLTADLLSSAADLDQRALGGLWTLDGYQRELDSPNSDLLILQKRPSENSTDPHPPLLGLGCLWAILEEAHITVLAIHPTYQRQGLGQTLLWGLLWSAWKRQLEWATLEVRASNQAAISLYQMFGFREIGRRKGYYQDTHEDALVLWRNGLHHPDFEEMLKVWQHRICDRLNQSGWKLSGLDERDKNATFPSLPLDLGTVS